MHMQNNIPLEVNMLTKSYPGTTALKELSFQIEKNDIFGLLGPNGAGKTSLISILTTLELPSSGSVRIFGYDVVSENKFSKPLVGVVPQEIINHNFFSVFEILEFHSGYYGIANNKDRIDYLLHRLKLYQHKHKMVKQLSGGMRRRLMIAKALVHSPQLLLLDEPTAGVDISLRETLWDFVLELQKQGVTTLLTTHYLQEAENLCNKILVINEGRLLCLKPTADVIAELSRRKVVVTLNYIKQISHPYLFESSNAQVSFLLPANVQVGEILQQAGIKVEEILDIQVKEGGLDEALKNLLKGDSK